MNSDKKVVQLDFSLEIDEMRLEANGHHHRVLAGDVQAMNVSVLKKMIRLVQTCPDMLVTVMPSLSTQLHLFLELGRCTDEELKAIADTSHAIVVPSLPVSVADFYALIYDDVDCLPGWVVPTGQTTNGREGAAATSSSRGAAELLRAIIIEYWTTLWQSTKTASIHHCATVFYMSTEVAERIGELTWSELQSLIGKLCQQRFSIPIELEDLLHRSECEASAWQLAAKASMGVQVFRQA